MKTLVFIIMFLFLGAFFVISNNNFHLINSIEFNQFASAYYSWFGQIFANAKTITGYVVNLNWLP